jgi:four helix bundle protein
MDVYKRALLFTKLARRATGIFPKDELYALNSQYRRAADSIALNRAEGTGNDSKREFAKFPGYSSRSGYECGSCADIAVVQKYITKKEYDILTKETDEIISMLIGLKRNLEK